MPGRVRTSAAVGLPLRRLRSRGVRLRRPSRPAAARYRSVSSISGPGPGRSSVIALRTLWRGCPARQPGNAAERAERGALSRPTRSALQRAGVADRLRRVGDEPQTGGWGTDSSFRPGLADSCREKERREADVTDSDLLPSIRTATRRQPKAVGSQDVPTSSGRWPAGIMLTSRRCAAGLKQREI